MRIIYNVTEPLPNETSKRDQIGTHPIFVVRKCKKSRQQFPCCIYIDHQLRVYNSFDEYIANVKLHKCVMVLPTNGIYQIKEDLVALTRYYSPSCGMASQLLVAADVGTSVIGIASGVTAIAATAITATATTAAAVAAAPIVLTGAAIAGVGAGIYGLGRGVQVLFDRKKHDEVVIF